MDHQIITEAGSQLLLAFKGFFEVMAKRHKMFIVAITPNDEQELLFKIQSQEQIFSSMEMTSKSNRNTITPKNDKTHRFFKNIEFFVGDERNEDIHLINNTPNHHDIKKNKTTKAIALDTTNKDNNDRQIDLRVVQFSSVSIFIGQFDGCLMKSSQSLLLALSVISKLANIKTLDLSFHNCNLGAGSIEAISTGISCLHRLQCLSLNFKRNSFCFSTPISQSPLSAFAQALSVFHDLQTLNINFQYCFISNKGLDSLSDGLQSLIHLKKLILNLKYNEIRHSMENHLSDTITKMKNLQKIDLNFESNFLSCESAVSLVSAVATNSQYLTSFSINLERNFNGEDIIKSFGGIFGRLKNLYHLSLNLSNNDMNHSGYASFQKGISQLKCLVSLELYLKENFYYEETSLMRQYFLQRNSKLVRIVCEGF